MNASLLRRLAARLGLLRDPLPHVARRASVSLTNLPPCCYGSVPRNADDTIKAGKPGDVVTCVVGARPGHGLRWRDDLSMWVAVPALAIVRRGGGTA